MRIDVGHINFQPTKFSMGHIIIIYKYDIDVDDHFVMCYFCPTNNI